MPQGTAINHNSHLRQQLPRQIDGDHNPFAKSGFFFIPFEPSEAERRTGKKHKEEGSGALVVVFLLATAFVAGFYWMQSDRKTSPTALSNTLAANFRRVDAYQLNMREMPNLYSPVKFILPQGTQVEVMNEPQQEFDGYIWVMVRVQTREGLHDGWVDARYLR